MRYLAILFMPLLAFAAVTSEQRLGVDQVVIGRPTPATDPKIKFQGVSNVIKANRTTGEIQFSNDGTNFSNMARPVSTLLENVGIQTSVSANALTVALKVADGTTNPSASSPVKISFRDATATVGGFVTRSVTGALSVVISSGSTLGCTSAQACTLWVYALDNSGTVELAVRSVTRLDESVVQTSTAEGGAGAADSASVLYSTAARTSKAVRLIGRITITETTAGTWASNATDVTLIRGDAISPTIQTFTSGSGTYVLPAGVSWIKVRMAGGGGGGGGGGINGTAGVGTAGGNTTFGSLSTNGGGAGSTGGNAACSGGTTTFSGTGYAYNGAVGGGASFAGGGFDSRVAGGMGGGTPFGGAGGAGQYNLAGSGATANTGSGGGGGGTNSNGANVMVSGGGGCAGGYIETWINDPASSYSYAIGASSSGGTAGTSGSAGGNGAAGVIVVEEYY